MFTYNERDLHRMPTPAKSHLPMKDFIRDSGILDEEGNSAHSNDADVALLRLPAPSLRGTFAKAYGLLAKLVSQIGWDELLKCRSQVFVMEEEYRMQKANDGPDSPSLPHANGNGGGPNTGEDDEEEKEEEEEEGFGPLALAEDGADDDASIKGQLESETPTISVTPSSAEKEGANGSGSPAIPTIKVSTESEGERERNDLAEYEEAAGLASAAARGVEKPKTAVQGEEGEEQTITVPSAEAPGASANGTASPGSFNNKRLCERWLDNLFMVLYEVRPSFPPRSYLAWHPLTWEFVPSLPGPPSIHDLARRGRALQGPAPPVPQDGHRVGDPRRARPAPAPQGGGQGRVPARARRQVLRQGVAQVARVLRRRGRRAAQPQRRHSLVGVPAPVVHGECRACLFLLLSGLGTNEAGADAFLGGPGSTRRRLRTSSSSSFDGTASPRSRTLSFR